MQAAPAEQDTSKKKKAESPTPFFTRGTNIVKTCSPCSGQTSTRQRSFKSKRKTVWNLSVQAHKLSKRHLCILPLYPRENCDLNILHKLRIGLSLDNYSTVKAHLLTIRHSVFQRLCLPVVTGYWPLGVTSIVVTTNEFTAIPLPVEVLQLLKKSQKNDCSPESCYLPKTTHSY